MRRSLMIQLWPLLLGASSLAAQEAAPETVRMSSGVAAGQILSKPLPQLSTPEERVSGSVVLHVLIGTTGLVQSVSVLSGPPAKAKKVAEAVQRWVYRPFEKDDRPVQVDTTVTLTICFGK